MKRISWNQFFMGVAQVSAMRSQDPNTKVGCCIASPQNKIVSTGYNGMPRTCDEHDLPWEREGDWLETKYPYVVHAELNAILNATTNNLNGCKLYVTLFPCSECTKAILQSGIKELYYFDDKHAAIDTFKASKKMLELSGVKCIKYQQSNKINIDV